MRRMRTRIADDGGLKLLEAVSNLIRDKGIAPEGGGGSATAAER